MLKQKSQMLTALRHILAPDAVVDVGIGSGLGEVHQWHTWNVPLALLVDADAGRVQWTQDLLEQNDEWQLAIVLLADSAKKQDFFITSNKAESSVVAIEQLRQIWPNMQLTEQQALPTQCLQTLLSSPSSQVLREASCIWGVIDCLSALPILQGAGNELKQWSVLWVRVLLDDVFSDTSQQNNSSLIAITDFLTPLGYRCIEVIEENHPAIGYALFIQDWYKQQKISSLQLDTSKKQVVDLQQQNQQQQDAQTKELEASKKQVVDLQQQNQQQQDAQTKELEASKKRVVDLQQQNQQQQDAQAKELEASKKQVVDLQQQNQKYDYRQQLLDEEFIKAEAQIELIKDVLLREKSL